MELLTVEVKGGGAYDDPFTLRYNNRSIGKDMIWRSQQNLRTLK
jgi:hypothetical protein